MLKLVDETLREMLFTLKEVGKFYESYCTICILFERQEEGEKERDF